MAGFIFSLAAACGQRALPPEAWQTCNDVGFALGERVDTECLSEVNKFFSFIDEEGDFYNLWGEYAICELFGEVPGRSTVDSETMEQLRVCGAWLIHLTCEEVAKKLNQIIVEKAKDVGQPPECNPLVETLQQLKP